MTGSRRILEDHVDRSITDAIRRKSSDDFAFQKTCGRDLGLNKRIKVQDVRCERLRIQNIASLIFKSDIEISHYTVLLLDYLIHNTCNRGDGVKLLLNSFSYIGESGQLHHAPSEGLRLLALFEQHKSGVVVEHPVAVCSCNLRSAVLLVQPGSVAKSRIAGIVQHVSGSDKALHRFAAVDDLPCLVLVVHVGIGNAAERVLLVHLHHSLLPVRVRLVQRLQCIECGSDRK